MRLMYETQPRKCVESKRAENATLCAQGEKWLRKSEQKARRTTENDTLKMSRKIPRRSKMAILSETVKN